MRRFRALFLFAPARSVVVLALLAAGNVLLWLLAWGLSARYPVLLATGGLAYGFGLRHAVDADHIAAIDNTTRKLMSEGRRPVGVGLFFSLGHSTVVLGLCAALALSAAWVQTHLPLWRVLGGLVGTLTSACFLYVIGLLNLGVIWNLRAPGADERGPRGLIGWVGGPLFGLVRRSRHMFWVGFLFGLGFDTASEVGILALSARAGRGSVPFGAVMLLPLLFMAAMCFVDTLNGVLMLRAYGWASLQPSRRALYNLTITGVSVLVAFGVATYELLPLIGAPRSPGATLGFAVLGASLLGAALIYARRRRKRAPDACPCGPQG